MKEMSLEEVLRIAGGLPVSAALDEVTYLANLPCPGEVAAGTSIQQPHSQEAL